MTRGSRGLCGLYILIALWLAWCTVNGWGHEHPSISALNAAASIVAIIAVVRETVLRDERRTVAELRERAARPVDGAPLNAGERAAWQDIAAHWDDREAA